MWISQTAWLAERADYLKLLAERDAAVQQLKTQEVSLGWFMHRLTQVEQERSKMIYNFTGVKVDAPVYEKDDSAATILAQNPLNSLPNFGDVGDIEALKQGIDWDANGELVYTK